MNDFWIAIGIIGLATYATRALPLFWHQAGREQEYPAAWLDRLGPCLLAAMAVTVIAPVFDRELEWNQLFSPLIGLLSAGVSMMIRRDPGLATLTGVVMFYIASM